jgi:hypothetical protein
MGILRTQREGQIPTFVAKKRLLTLTDHPSDLESLMGSIPDCSLTPSTCDALIWVTGTQSRYRSYRALSNTKCSKDTFNNA